MGDYVIEILATIELKDKENMNEAAKAASKMLKNPDTIKQITTLFDDSTVDYVDHEWFSTIINDIEIEVEMRKNAEYEEKKVIEEMPIDKLRSMVANDPDLRRSVIDLLEEAKEEDE
jgi:hypothetical protein